MEGLFREIGAKGDAARRDRERGERIAASLYDSLFPEQRAVVDDPNDHKTVRCPRRAGKSHLGAAAGLRVCLLKPGAEVLIVGLAHHSVKQAFWGTLQRLVAKYNIPGRGENEGWHSNDMTFTLANGSRIRLYGAETADRVERLRGGEWDLAIVDEAKSFTPEVLDYLIQDVLEPGLGTRGGELWLVGTPGSLFAGVFYWGTNPGMRMKIRGERELGETEVLGPVVAVEYRPGEMPPDDVLWTAHSWSMQANTGVKCVEVDGKKVPKQWLDALRRKRARGWADDHPTWRREYLGEWVTDESGLVFALAGLRYSDPARVLWTPQPSPENPAGVPNGEWDYVLGIDFGQTNPTAFIVVAVCQAPQMLLEVHSEAHQGLSLKEIAEVYRRLVARFGGFSAVVVDTGGLGVMIADELAGVYGIPAIPAEKRDKMAHIALINSDLHTGRIKVVDGSELCDQMTRLCFDLSTASRSELERKGTLRVDPKMEDDLCDAFLYTYRYCTHRWELAKTDHGPAAGTKAWWIAREAEAKERAFQEREARRREEEGYEGERILDEIFGSVPLMVN